METNTQDRCKTKSRYKITLTHFLLGILLSITLYACKDDAALLAEVNAVRIMEHLQTLYPNAKWGRVSTAVTDESGRVIDLEFNIGCEPTFVTSHPDAKKEIRKSILKKHPKISKVPMAINFFQADSTFSPAMNVTPASNTE